MGVRVLALLAAVFLRVSSLCGAPAYTITEIAPPPGVLETDANGINDSNQVIGRIRFGDHDHPYVWQNGHMIDLFDPSSPNGSYAFGINNAGHVVGAIGPPTGGALPFFWNGSDLVTLATPNGAEGYPTGINGSGEMIGLYMTSNSTFRPLYWRDPTAPPVDTFALSGNVNPTDINNVGQILLNRFFREGTTTSEAYLWDRGSLTFLGGFGGNGSRAFAINNNTQVVGSSRDAAGTLFAFLWQDGQMAALPSLPGALGGTAFDINDAGQIIGSALAPDGTVHAVLWEDGAIYDFNDAIPPDSGWYLDAAMSINSSGSIVGYGFNGYQRGFLLTPVTVPAPETCLTGLVGLAFVVLLHTGRRFRHARS